MKDFEYFRDFLENPETYKTFDFYKYANEWAEYVMAHAAEFNYFEDDNWKEIRDRILLEFGKREEVRSEIEEIETGLVRADQVGDDNLYLQLSVELHDLIKKHQYNLNFSDEALAKMEKKLETCRRARYTEYNNTQEKNVESTMETGNSVEDLDDTLAAHFERTGKRMAHTSLKAKKSNKRK